MIGDKGREVVASSDNKSLQPCAYISLEGKRHQPGEMPCTDPNFRFTNFDYYVKYKESANKTKRYKPYVICADIFTFEGFKSIRVKDYEEFLEKAKTNKELAWIVKHTIHSKKLFDLAKANIHLPMKLIIDIVKYADEVIKNDPNGDKAKDVFMIRDLAEAEKIRHEQYLKKIGKKEIKL